MTKHLRDLLVDYGLEVSSPGPSARSPSRTTSAASSAGARRVRTREPVGGQRSFTGELVGASEEEVTVAAGDGVVSIPYAEINRSNLAGGRRR